MLTFDIKESPRAETEGKTEKEKHETVRKRERKEPRTYELALHGEQKAEKTISMFAQTP